MVTSSPAHPSWTAPIAYSGEPSDPYSRDYLFELAEESGLGSVFVPTDRPLAKGSVISMDFDPASSGVEGAKGIVTWRRSWFGERGMMVQVFEIEKGDRKRRRRRRRRSSEGTKTPDVQST